MTIRNGSIALALGVLLASCSGEDAAKADKLARDLATEKAVAIARTHVKVTPAVPDDVKGEDRMKMQEALIETMSSSPDVSPEVFEGEAYRRGVKLTPDLIARKKASYKPPQTATKPR